MKINKSANFTDFAEFMILVENLKSEKLPFSFSGNVNANENNQDNFSVNWASDEEVWKGK